MTKITENYSHPRPEEDRNNPDEPPRYNVYELCTDGWEVVNIDDELCENLVKEVSQQKMQMMLDNGVSPDRIKVVRVS